MVRYSFTEGFSLAQIQQREALNAFRKAMGGSRGLEKESMKIIKNDAKQESKAFLSNPEEILDKKNVSQLETELTSNPIAKPWWNTGDNEQLDIQGDDNDEKVIQASRTNNLAYENRLQPTPSPEGQASVQRDIRDLLQEQKNKSTMIEKIKNRARKSRP